MKVLGEPKLISERMQRERLKTVGVKKGSGGVTTGYRLHISRLNDYLGHTGADTGPDSPCNRMVAHTGFEPVLPP